MSSARARAPAPAPRRSAAAPALLLAACLCLGACATRGGHYYQDDGPPEKPPAGLAQTPDAVPRIEALNPRANRPYSALGRSYTPDTGDAPFEQRGIASWYGRQYHGNPTASGEPYDMYAMSAAHPTLPIPSYARVTRTSDRRSIIVRINDRGPFLQDRVIDLSYAAATRLGIVGPGSGEVIVQKITARDIAAGTFGAPAAVASAAPAPAEAPAPQAVVTRVAAAPADPVAASVAPVAPAAPVAPTIALPSVALPMAPAPQPPQVAVPAPVVPSIVPVATVAPVAAPVPEVPTPATAGLPSTAGTAADAGAAAPPAAAAAVDAPVAAPAAAPAAAPTTAPATSAATPVAPPAVAGEAAAAQNTDAPPPAPTPPSGKWAVQLGAFAVQAHAEALRDEVTTLLARPDAEALPAASRHPRIEFDGRLHRVLVGTFDVRAAAQRGATQLRRYLARDTSLYQH